MPLPDAILEAWEPDTQARLGGIMELAGIDPTEAFMPTGIKDHPWLGLEVAFPFPEVRRGKIIRCVSKKLGDTVELHGLEPPAEDVA